MNKKVINRKLLWKAWPEGCLAMRGVVTVGGWTCVAAKGDVAGMKEYAFWLGPDLVSLYGVGKTCAVGYGGASPLDVTPVREAIQRGDLLPDTSSADPANWACLLADLAQAGTWVRGSHGAGVKAPSPAEDPGMYNLEWSQDSRGEEGVTFSLTASSRLILTSPRSFADHVSWIMDFDPATLTTDPALALVLARVEARLKTRKS